MNTDRLTEISTELRSARGAEILAEGSLREAVGLGQWATVHGAVDELREACEEREALEAELEDLLIAELTA